MGTGRGPPSQAIRPSVPLSKRMASFPRRRRSDVAMDSRVAVLAVCRRVRPIVWAALPPVPTPSTTRPSASSARLATALAVTEMCRVCGTAIPGPSRMREVPRAQAVSVTHSSRHTRWVSVIQTVS